jgi:hypothetical protein
MQQKTVKAALCSLGNTRPGQKIPGLSSEGTVRHHLAAQAELRDSHFI